MCSIEPQYKKWTIDKETLMQLYPLLYEKIEIGGKFTFPFDCKTQRITRKTSIKKIHTQKGQADSVQAPTGIVNFHTHPISCYIGEDTVWGWPSAEDIRECILFGLKGSMAHAVLSVEGVYLLQVSQCILEELVHIDNYVGNVMLQKINPELVKHVMDKYIDYVKSSYSQEMKEYLQNKGINSSKKLAFIIENELYEYLDTNKVGDMLKSSFTDIIRGIILIFIEVYFRSTHRFRSSDIKGYYPEDFIKFVEAFRIKNIFNGSKVKGCGKKLKCARVPVHGSKNTKFEKYVEEYEYDTGFYIADSHGAAIGSIMKVNEIFEFIPLIQDMAKKVFKCKKWFHITLTPNQILFNERYIPYNSKKLSRNEKKDMLNYYNQHPLDDAIIIKKSPTFRSFGLQGKCHSKDVKKHIRSRKKRR